MEAECLCRWGEWLEGGVPRWSRPLLPGSVTASVPCAAYNGAFQPDLQNRLCVSLCEPALKRAKLPQRLRAALRDSGPFPPVPAVISLCTLPGLSCSVVPGALPCPRWQLQKPVGGVSCTGAAGCPGRRVSSQGAVSSRGGSYSCRLSK